ncbi:exonuclease mut-7 homolog isoform X2 [Stegostoma tigrinum]|uniref:exonuclease mut-7 homolog isoform X2 n=1 Tax=Stegostoma tigrinum TaxID=3053191 RepID=UPI00286FE22B|nr:exonuclease mut-7 homolog isoform X2 [Stegostoma tigrinum]
MQSGNRICCITWIQGTNLIMSDQCTGIEQLNTLTTEPGMPQGLDPLHLLHILQALWTKKEIHELPEAARRGFASLTDPLEGLLVMLENCHDWRNWRKGKPQTLAHYIIDQLCNWIKDNGRVPQPTKLQARVFSLLTEVPANMLDQLASLYEVDKADRSSQLGLINGLCIKGKYKEAALLSIKLGLQPELDMEQVCIPLLLQDKVSLVEAYVADCPGLQRALLQLLDSWCHSMANIADIQRRYEKLSHLRWNKLNRKALSKLVIRLMELYDINPEFCPNVMNQRQVASIKYLLYKRFMERSMSEENWSEHIEAVVGYNPQLRLQFVTLLARYTDIDTVARWVLRLNVPREKLAYHVAERLKQLERVKAISLENHFVEESIEEIQNKKKFYYQLPIPTECIHFLDHLDQLKSCAARVLQAGGILGIDMEWRPTFGVLTRSRVSLIQIAMKDCVYLLDLPQLVNQSESECRRPELTQFIQTLFTDQTITKLGYATTGDLRTLSVAYPMLKDVVQHTAGVLDLLNVHKEKMPCRRQDKSRGVEVLMSEDGVNCGNSHGEKGLSLLVQCVLGKSLDKTEQLSNWEKRPLRPQQVIYAASDAYCLLDVYDALHRDPQRFGLNCSFEEFLMFKMEKKTRGMKEKKNKSSPTLPFQCAQIPQPNSLKASSFPPLSPSEFNVVCDNMLQGLGRYLRCLGVDVKILENDDHHRKAAEIACKDNRFILTCGLPYHALRSQVAEGRCLSLNCSDKAKDQAITVLKHFNVQITPKDIFSRCQVCNGAEYLKLPVEEMRQAVQLKACSGRAMCTDPPTAMRSSSSADQAVVSPQTDAGNYLGQAGRCSYNPRCHWADKSRLDLKTLKFTSGAVLQVETIPPGILDKVVMFYCCVSCGKVFWEGSHFNRIVSQFQEVLHVTDKKTFYHP